jgi:hypothetical protein
MKVAFSDKHKVAVMGILSIIQRNVKTRDMRRRLSQIAGKFETNSSFVHIKKGELALIREFVQVGIDHAEQLQLKDERLDTLQSLIEKIGETFAANPHG